MLQILTSTYILLMAVFGSLVATILLCMQLGLQEEIIVFLSLTVATITFIITLLFCTEDFDKYDTFSLLAFVFGSIAIFYLMRTSKGKTIRSNIRVFLSDKGINQINKCPYNLNHSTLLSQATQIIWEQERRKRLDDLVLLQEINV